MSMIIRLDGLGARHFEKDIVITTEVDSGSSAICKISVGGNDVDLYPAELDKLIDSLTLVKNHTS